MSCKLWRRWPLRPRTPVPALSGFLSGAGRGREAFLAKAHRRVCLSHGAGIPPYSGPTKRDHENHYRRFCIGAGHHRFWDLFGSVLMSGGAPHADPDPATLAVAHALKSRPESRP
jgi:hypothetical protein